MQEGRSMDGYERLANAIIIQAAKDYRAVYRRILKDPENTAARYEAESLERFFQSQYFQSLTDADGGAIVNKLQEIERMRFYG